MPVVLKKSTFLIPTESKRGEKQECLIKKYRNMKTYFYASYMLNVNKADVCTIIKAQSQAQIKRAGMHLHEN